ncbi:hypothetical protein SLS62_011449, partial [Diatrype stigma]
KAIELRTMWPAGTITSSDPPPPSLNPFPSPWKSEKPHRSYPLPHEYTSSIVTGDSKSQRSRPSSTLSQRRALRNVLPVPEPSLQAKPSADSPFLRGSRLRYESR